MSLRIKSISVVQFKNYFQQEFFFDGRIVGICGRNGVGKTNLLDAICYLSFTKSYFTRQDAQNVLKGHQGFRIAASLDVNGEGEMAVCVLRENGKKEFSVNDQLYTKFSKHIGRYPCVIIAPDDVQLIIGHSEERRAFIDTMLSQLDAAYLQSLIQYNRILLQRNSFLKNYADGYGRDLGVLDILDEQLVKEGALIFERRRNFLLSFLPLVKQLYNEISKRYEDVSFIYESELMETSFAELLAQNRAKDLLIQRTSSGIHRDELSFRLGDQPFKNIASQGQRKSLLFSLKLGEMEVIRNEKHLSPILLLDDVFEKLDEERITNLLEKVCADEDAQIFITDTSCDRLQEQFDKMGRAIQLVQL